MGPRPMPPGPALFQPGPMLPPGPALCQPGPMLPPPGPMLLPPGPMLLPPRLPEAIWQMPLALVGLVLNIVLNLALMRFVGVAGLALATSLSLWITSLLLLLWTHRHEHIHIVDIILLSLVWLLYLTLLLCLHYGSYSGVAVSMLALLVLFAENRHLIFRETDQIVALPRLSTG